MPKILLQILKVLVAPFMGIKYCKSSCCESECMKNNNIDEYNNDALPDKKD